jgi:hypothetical protein
VEEPVVVRIDSARDSRQRPHQFRNVKIPPTVCAYNNGNGDRQVDQAVYAHPHVVVRASAARSAKADAVLYPGVGGLPNEADSLLGKLYCATHVE